MASQELIAIKNSPQPTISAEGQRAKENIAKFRQMVDSGATAKEARATLRQPAKADTVANNQSRNNTVITPASLEQEPAFKLTPPAPTVQGASLLGTLEQETDTFTQNLEAQKKQAETNKGTALDAYLASLQNRQGYEGFVTQLEDQTGFQEIENELNDINQQIREEQLALRRAVERLQGKGNLKGMTETAIANIERESLAKQADLSIIQLGKQAKYDSALARIDRKAKALFEQENNFIEAMKINYQENKDLFTVAEQRLFETKLADRERKLQEEIDNRKAIDEFALRALQAGAPTSVAQNIMSSAKTLDEAIAMGGDYLRPKPVVSSTKRDTQVVDGKLIDMQTGEIIRDLSDSELGNSSEIQKTIDQLSFLRETAKQANEIANSGGLITTPIGPSAINRALGYVFVGNTSFQQLQNKTDTLKTNVLSLMTNPDIRKFFGPQMSNADVQLIQSAGSTLNPMTQSKADYIKELQRLDDLLNRMETALKQGQQALLPPVLVTGPNGVLYEIVPE